MNRWGRGLTVIALLTLGCTEPPLELPTVESNLESPLREPALAGTLLPEARVTDYLLEAHLDAEKHQVEGRARVIWRNASEVAVERMPFHLYMNGFRAEDTAWMTSSRGRHRQNQQSDEGSWGYIDVRSVHLLPGPTGLDQAFEPMPGEAVSLPFAELDEPSLMEVELPAPVAPGETVALDLEFTTQLPRVLARTGYSGDFHAVAQWYPKLGVLEKDGTWNAHDFTVRDEFFADFGHYVVHLDVPERMVVGATGLRTAERLQDERKLLTYEAEMVHDFVFMTDPNFVEHSILHEGVYVRQLIQPEHVEDADVHMTAQLEAFESYENRYGSYPWSTLTIVHPPEGGEGAGGMEYPTFFTTSDRAQIPGWVRRYVFEERMSGVRTTVHEFGHQYFQGLLASREHEQPWLDEGLNSFSNHMAHLDQYSEDPWVLDFFGNRLYSEELERLGSDFVGGLDALDQPARAFDSLTGSFRAIYIKTSVVLVTLRNLVGHEAFDRAFKKYCEDWRFRHPRGEDFEAAMIAELGERIVLDATADPPVELDLVHYFEQALRTTHRMDFAIEQVDNRRRLRDAGYQRDEHGELVGGDPPENLDTSVAALKDEDVTGVVVVRRDGAFQVPVEFLVHFADGEAERFTWDGRGGSRVYTWPGRRVERATLDPNAKLGLEARRLDNSARAEDLPGDDGLSPAAGDLVEGLSLALLGGLGL